MPDSLIIDGQIELIGNHPVSTLPSCAGAIFVLNDNGMSLGVPQPVADIVATLTRDGEVPQGERTSNRAPALPISITAADRDTVVAARETILKIMNKPLWTMTWTREGGQAVVFSCFRAGPPDILNEPIVEKQALCEMTMHFSALPFGQSDTITPINFSTAVQGVVPLPPPVELDTCESLASGNSGWSLSSQHVEGSDSVANLTVPYGTTGIPGGATYSATISSKNITGLSQISFYAGFQTVPGPQGFFWYSQNYFASYPNVSFSVTLTDSHGKTLTFAETDNNLSSSGNGPVWTNITVPIPQGSTTFDYTTVVHYTITMLNYLGRAFIGAYPFIDAVWAANQTSQVSPPSQRGAIYQVVDIKGSARTPLTCTLQQPANVIPITQVFHASGSWTCPYNVQTIDISGTGTGGTGANRSTSGTAGGGGAGAWSREPAMQVTYGKTYNFTIPAPSSTPGVSPGDITFAGDNVTLTVHGGNSAPANSATGGLGGLASGNTQSFPGGNGFTATAPGAGGGSPATPSGAGNNATGQAGATAQSGGVAGGTGGNAGNNPGGAAPGTGAGGGGACSTGTAEPGGLGGVGTLTITYVGALPQFGMSLIHIPSPDNPDTLPLYVPVPGTGAPGVPFPITSPVTGLPARFNGTYSIAVVAKNGIWDSPSTQRKITVSVFEWDYVGAPTYSSVQTVFKTFTPTAAFPDGAPNGFITIGELSLPNREIPVDNTQSFYTMQIDDTDGSDAFMDVLFMDSQGQTIIVNEPSLQFAQVFIDLADSSRDLGMILGTTTDRTRAVSVMDNTFATGGQLLLVPDVTNSILVYSTAGAPGLLGGYYAQWWVDRILDDLDGS